MSIGPKGNNSVFQYKVNGDILKEVTHHSYLGVDVEFKLKWEHQITKIVNKAKEPKIFSLLNMKSWDVSTERKMCSILYSSSSTFRIFSVFIGIHILRARRKASTKYRKGFKICGK